MNLFLSDSKEYVQYNQFPIIITEENRWEYTPAIKNIFATMYYVHHGDGFENGHFGFVVFYKKLKNIVVVESCTKKQSR